ncbi:hypothetical protein, partial [Xanthomonas oryzae]
GPGSIGMGKAGHGVIMRERCHLRRNISVSRSASANRWRSTGSGSDLLAPRIKNLVSLKNLLQPLQIPSRSWPITVLEWRNDQVLPYQHAAQ